jgi:hypothetical protein
VSGAEKGFGVKGATYEDIKSGSALVSCVILNKKAGHAIIKNDCSIKAIVGL